MHLEFVEYSNDSGVIIMNESICNVDKYNNKAWKDSNGMYHRVDGPAVEFADGDKSWYIHGECHRVDGPAVERADGYKA